jgi:rhodanese-related sulfurtransferase
MDQRTYEEMVADAKTRIREVTPREALEGRRAGDDAVFLDVREPQEWNLFRIPGAVHVPLAALRDQVEGAVPRDRKVIIYCARGNRSALAADAMQELGYHDVASLAQGIRGGWRWEGTWRDEKGEGRSESSRRGPM